MSIYDNLQRLVTAKTNIANAITEMGGTVNTGDGFEEFPADIATIHGGNKFEINVDDMSDSKSSVTSGNFTIIITKPAYLSNLILIYGADTFTRLKNAGAYLDWSANISYNAFASNAGQFAIQAGFGYSSSTSSTAPVSYLSGNYEKSIAQRTQFANSETVHYTSNIANSSYYLSFGVKATFNNFQITLSASVEVSNISCKLIIPNS